VKLKSIAKSRTELGSRVERARILLAYRKDAVVGHLHQSAQRCIERSAGLKARWLDTASCGQLRLRAWTADGMPVSPTRTGAGIVCKIPKQEKVKPHEVPPDPGGHARALRRSTDIVSLVAGIDLVTSKAHALVRDRDRSGEFIEFLKIGRLPAHTAIEFYLENHSAHI
jgi:hypothetical protein